MVAPYNYILPNQPNPLEAAVSGLRLGATIEEIQAARQQRAMQQQAMEAQRQQQIALQGALSDFAKNPTTDQLLRLAPMLPKEVFANVNEAFKQRSEGQQKGYLNVGAQALAAIQAGQPTVAVDTLKRYGEAAANAGDAEGARSFEMFAKLVEANPETGMLTMGTMLANLPGGKEAIEGISKVGTERRAQLAFTPEQAKREADAKTAQIEADMRRQVLRAGINLQGAQAAQASASAEKTREETKRAKEAAAAAPAGVIPPDKRPEFEQKLRKEYNDQTAPFREVRDAYQRIKASTPDAVGDLSLIFGYMKMLDPGSVVREGEFATAQNAAGVPEVVRNAWNRALSGERLSDNQRGAFKAQAGKLYQVQETQAKATRAGIERIATGYGLNPKNLFYDEDAPAPTPAPANPQPGAPAAPANRNVTVDW